ncbi:hypothetical protein VTN02DRAFT_2857 [Thermoascus thermophilus]
MPFIKVVHPENNRRGYQVPASSIVIDTSPTNTLRRVIGEWTTFIVDAFAIDALLGWGRVDVQRLVLGGDNNLFSFRGRRWRRFD